MSAQDNIAEAQAEAEAVPLAALVVLLIMGSCANTPKNVNQDKKPPLKLNNAQMLQQTNFTSVIDLI